MRLIASMAVLALLVGCATQPSVKELRGDAKTAVFIQYGDEPLSVGYGIVNGKTFWANMGGANTTAASDSAAKAPGVSRADAAAGGLMVAGIGQAAQASLDKERPEIEATMRGFLKGTDYAPRLIELIQPTVTNYWGVQQVAPIQRVKADPGLFADQDGAYLGTLPTQADLLIVASVNSVVLDEASLVGGFVHALTLGAGERGVRPSATVGITVFKPDAKGRYVPIWRNSCMARPSEGPVHTVSEMKKDPALAKTVFTESIPSAATTCGNWFRARS